MALSANEAEFAPARGLRQKMSGLHIWAGVLAGWVLYAMFLTGTVSYFREEISQWMRPELPAYSPDASRLPAVAQRMVAHAQAVAPNAPSWIISLPDHRHNAGSVNWSDAKGFHGDLVDPDTGMKPAVRETEGGDFFYEFHFQFHYLPPVVGRVIAGLAGMFMLVAIISGVITHKKIFVDFFTFRRGRGQRAWLDAHNALSVFGLPFHLMIAYTGLVTLMFTYMPWSGQASFKTLAQRIEAFVELTAILPPVPAHGRPAALADVGSMVSQAQARWGAESVGRVFVDHPGDTAARVMIARNERDRVSQSPQTMTFDGTSGRLLQVRDSVGPAAESRNVMYALHLGRFADTVTRWLYFIVSLAGTAMVATGLALWTIKRRSRLRGSATAGLGLRVVERGNVVAVGGLSIAMAAFLWANRLLPLDAPDRAHLEVNLFFAAWACSLLHAWWRPVMCAWREQLWAAVVLLALLPLSSLWTPGRNAIDGRGAVDTLMLTFDLTLLGMAALHAAIVLRLRRRAAAPPP